MDRAVDRGPEETDSRFASLSAVALGASVILWVYAASVVLWILAHSRHPEATWWLSNWAAVPAQVAAAAFVVLLLKSHTLPAGQRASWWLLLGFVGINFAANIVWNATWAAPRSPHITIGDALYIGDYLLLCAAFVLQLRAAGGSLRDARFWRDTATVVVALFAALWAFLFAPYLPSDADPGLSVGTTATYAAALTMMMAMGALLFSQTGSQRIRSVALLLIGAGLCEAAWEIAWLAGQLGGRSYVGLLYNLGDLLCFALVTSAAAAAIRSKRLPEATAAPEAVAYGFLPILSVLVAVALVSGSAMTAHGVEAWIRIGLVICGVFLLVARQRSVRRELKTANQALAVRVSDARVTELVRQSADLLLVADDALRLTFVSPAAMSMLAAQPGDLMGRAVTEVLGAANANRVHAFLQTLRTPANGHGDMEFIVIDSMGQQRLLRMSGSNQLPNPLIAGIVLVLSDVTRQRALEHEVVDAVTRERAHFCEQLHDNLGQDLSGIALLLHNAAANPKGNPVAQRDALQAIVGHVNRTITAARLMAEELSPLHVVRNSLSAALMRLIVGGRERTRARLEYENPGAEPFIAGDVGEQLYRIARDALSSAIGVSGCMAVRVSLGVHGDELTLTVAATQEINSPPKWREAMNLSLLEYRARIIGGAMSMEGPSEGVTRLIVAVPLQGMNWSAPSPYRDGAST